MSIYEFIRLDALKKSRNLIWLVLNPARKTKGGPRRSLMKEPRNVVINIDGKALTMELDLKDEELIELLVNALGLFVKKGSPIKVFQAYGRSLSSSSTTIVTKIMSKVEQVVEWRDELKKVISSQRGKL
jgi:hypothetical protein